MAVVFSGIIDLIGLAVQYVSRPWQIADYSRLVSLSIISGAIVWMV